MKMEKNKWRAMRAEACRMDQIMWVDQWCTTEVVCTRNALWKYNAWTEEFSSDPLDKKKD